MSATAVNFGSQPIGAGASTQRVYIHNAGQVPITVTSAILSATGQSGSGDFQIYKGSYCNGSGYLPAQLLPDSSCYLSVRFTPSASTSETASMTVTTSASANPRTIELSGVGVAALPAIQATPEHYVFPQQPLSVPSAPQTFHFHATGTSPVTIGRIAATGDFQVADSTCTNATLSPSHPGRKGPSVSCAVSVIFTPTASGSRTGTLTMADSAGNSPQSFNLMGTAAEAAGSLLASQTDLVFPPTPQGATAAGFAGVGPVEEDIYNTGNTPVQINSLTFTGDFSIEDLPNSCGPLPFVAAPGGGCSVYLTFTPTQTSGTESGKLVVGSTAGNVTVHLQGKAEPATQVVGLAPIAFHFGAVQEHATAGADGLSIVNVRSTGTIVAVLNGPPTISGPNGPDFAVLSSGGTCVFNAPLAPPTGVGPGSCDVPVQFTPSETGTETATLTLTDSAGTQTMTLTGTGDAKSPTVTLDPNTLVFDVEPAHTPPPYFGLPPNLPATLINNGPKSLTIQSAAITSGGKDFSVEYGTDGCSLQDLTAGSSCSLSVDFVPSAAGYRIGTLTFKDQNNKNYSVRLVGFAPVDMNSVTLDPKAAQFEPQSVSGNSNLKSLNFMLVNNGNTPLTVGQVTGTNLIIGSSTSGDFVAEGSDGCSTETLGLGGECVVTVLFKPATAGEKMGSISFPVTYGNGKTATVTGTMKGLATN